MLCHSRCPPRPLRGHPSREGMADAGILEWMADAGTLEGMADAGLLEWMADARKRNATPKRGRRAPLELKNLPYHLFPISYLSPSLPFTKIYNGRQ